MVENIATRMAEIAVSGSNQDLLQLVELMNKVFPLAKNGNGHGGEGSGQARGAPRRSSREGTA